MPALAESVFHPTGSFSTSYVYGNTNHYFESGPPDQTGGWARSYDFAINGQRPYWMYIDSKSFQEYLPGWECITNYVAICNNPPVNVPPEPSAGCTGPGSDTWAYIGNTLAGPWRIVTKHWYDWTYTGPFDRIFYTSWTNVGGGMASNASNFNLASCPTAVWLN